MGTTKIQGIIRNNFEKLFSNKLEIQEEMHKGLDTHEIPKLNQGRCAIPE